MRLEERVNKFSSYSNVEYNLIRYIFAHKREVASMQTTDLAQASYTSPASVVRLAKKLGFSGFNELKFFLKQEVELQASVKSESWDLLLKDVQQTIAMTSEATLLHLNSLIEHARRIFIFGTNWGEHNASELLIRNFLTVGVYMIAIPSLTELRWISEDITAEDLLIVVSFSGAHTEVMQLTRLIQLKGTEIISITPLSDNSLARLTSHNLYYHVSELVACSENPDAEYNMFTTLHIVMDALFRNYYDNFM